MQIKRYFTELKRDPYFDVEFVKRISEIKNPDGSIDFVPNGETITIESTDIYADDGFIFKNKLTGAILSQHITLGSDDSVENYEEISRPWS